MPTMTPKDRYFDIYKQHWGKPTASSLRRNRYLNHLLLGLLRSARNLGHHPIPDVYIGEVRSDQFQARVFDADEGHLILIHQGLFLFAAQAIQIFASVLELTFDGIVEPLSMPFDEAKALFIKLTNAFTSESAFHAVCRLTHNRNEFSGGLAVGFLEFVIAHEVAHILCGHCKNVARVRYFGFDKLSLEQEFEADITAMLLLKELKKKFVFEASVYYAPAIFFELAFTLRKRQSHHQITSHPHPTARLSRLIAKLVLRESLAMYFST
jgi:hypothetical protein